MQITKFHEILLGCLLGPPLEVRTEDLLDTGVEVPKGRSRGIYGASFGADQNISGPFTLITMI